MTTQVQRVDKYTVEVNGRRVRATPEQESRLRGMSDEEITWFLAAMGLDGDA